MGYVGYDATSSSERPGGVVPPPAGRPPAPPALRLCAGDVENRRWIGSLPRRRRGAALAVATEVADHCNAELRQPLVVGGRESRQLARTVDLLPAHVPAIGRRVASQISEIRRTLENDASFAGGCLGSADGGRLRVDQSTASQANDEQHAQRKRVGRYERAT